MTAMEVDISAIVAAARDAARKETHRDGAVPAPKPAAPRRLSKTFKALRQKHQQHAAAHPRASRPSAVGARTPAEAAPLPKGPAVSKKSADPGPSPMEEIPTKKEEAAPIKKATAPVAAVPKETEEERHRRIERAKMEDALMRNEAVRRGKRVAESGKPWHVWSVEECEDVLLYFSAAGWVVVGGHALMLDNLKAQRVLLQNHLSCLRLLAYKRQKEEEGEDVSRM